VADVAAALGSEDPHVRAEATGILAEHGAAAVPAIRQRLTDRDPRARRAAAQTLWQMGPEAQPAIPALGAALQDADTEVRRWSAAALVTIGPGDEATARALGRALSDKNLDVRRSAAEALIKMSAGAGKAFLVLGEMLEQEDVDTRRRLIHLLSRCDEPAAILLGKALKDENLGIRIRAAEALAKMGPEAKEAVPALQQALADPNPNPYVRERAAQALKRARSAAGPVARPESSKDVAAPTSSEDSGRATHDAKMPAPTPPALRFTDITRAAGIRFRHTNGAFGKKLLPETMGSGVAFLDYDGDGLQDLLLVNSCYWPGYEDKQRPAPMLALYRNKGDGTFEDVTAAAGLAVTLYGMGVTVGDYDNDGWPDVFITAVGGNRLFHNESGRRFVDVTARAGVGGPGGWPATKAGAFLNHATPINFSSSATFLDYDGDGRLDLFVCNYVGWSPAFDLSHDFKLSGIRTYGQPRGFAGTHCFLYRNQGDGRFQDVSAEAGIHISEPETGPVAKALGVVACDLDDDGWPDIVVANDGVRNFLFHNESDGQGGRRFTEIGIPKGIAYAEGAARAGMGIDWGEYRPGRSALLIGNFADEPDSLLRLDDSYELWFSDVAIQEGIAVPSRSVLKFGVFFFDYDLDGRQDLLTCNGHLAPEISRTQAHQTYAQPAQLFWNTGGRSTYAPVTEARAGPDLFRPLVGRGCAFADIDGDGYLDVVLTENGGPARLLRNEGGTGNNWIRLVLEGDGENSNRSAIGALVTVEAGGRVQRREVMSARGYLSQSELPLTFGLGRAETVDRVTIRWPGRNAGKQVLFGLEVNHLHTIRQLEN
jgi:HEAT repeat protein